MAMRQEVNAPLILTVGAVGVVMVLVVMIGLHAWYLNEERREQVAKSDSAPVPELVRLAREQQGDARLQEAMARVVSSGGKLPATRPATQQANGPATRPNAAPATRPATR
jgi:hypothetical protein